MKATMMMSAKRGKSPKVVEKISLGRHANGDLVATHHHAGYEHPSEDFPFKAKQGKQFLDHIKKHMGVEMAEEAGEK